MGEITDNWSPAAIWIYYPLIQKQAEVNKWQDLSVSRTDSPVRSFDCGVGFYTKWFRKHFSQKIKYRDSQWLIQSAVKTPVFQFFMELFIF